MTRNVWGIVSGLLVLVLGVVAVAGLVRPEEAPVEATTSASQALAVGSIPHDPEAPIAPDLPGVSDRISSVLEWNGDAGFADDEELAQLPPAVTAVLTQYGVPLRVPTTGEEG